jgi:hypothetical protein
VVAIGELAVGQHCHESKESKKKKKKLVKQKEKKHTCKPKRLAPVCVQSWCPPLSSSATPTRPMSSGLQAQW